MFRSRIRLFVLLDERPLLSENSICAAGRIWEESWKLSSVFAAEGFDAISGSLTMAFDGSIYHGQSGEKESGSSCLRKID